MKNRMFLLGVLVIFMVLLSCSAFATNYYMSPSGLDTNNGLSTTSAWRTFGRADDTVRPGDTLYVMGGAYTTVSTFYANSAHAGTQANHVTIRAYGDSPATFVSSVRIFSINSGADWFTVDGLVGGQRYLIFKANVAIGFNEVYANHVTLRGVEFDGSLANVAVESGSPLFIENANYLTVESSYIHDFWLPTYNNQGVPACIFISASDFFLLQNNKLEKCNHGGIVVAKSNPAASHGGNYGKIRNNFIDERYGSGITLNHNSMYNLVEGNVVVHIAETTTHPKPGLQLSGSRNTIRGNVFYATSDIGFELNSYLPVHGGHAIASDNLIYNNIAFGSGGIGFRSYVNNAGDPEAAAENNLFANNIIYKNYGSYEGASNLEIELDLYHSTSQHDWSNPDTPYDPVTTHFGGNKFYNNLVRDESAAGNGMGDPTIVLKRPGDGDMRWSLTTLHSLDSMAWQNNIGGNPLLVSENPDGYGLNNGWWKLQAGSPAIDAGRVVHDTLGAYVNSLYPGYGWADRPYDGLAPDIGAFEFGGAGAVCGNSVCESGENCGNCPSDCICSGGQVCCSNACLTPACSNNAACNDNNACTTDVCNSAGTCSAVCAHTAITQCINNDGCCPPNCNSGNDNNCVAVCGNNVVETGEVCDGTNLNGQTCITRGFTGGTLACQANCLAFNTAGCTNVTPSGSLLLHLPFDGSMVDVSGNGNVVSCTNCPALATGRLGQAYDFDGVNDAVQVANTAALSITGDVTLTAWIYPQGDFAGESILSKGYSNEYDLTFWRLPADNTPRLYYFDSYTGSSGNGHAFSYVFSQSQWYHVAVVRQGSTVRLYVNGVNVNDDYTRSGTITVSSNNVLVGNRPSGTTYFDGIIDDVRVYSRALSAAEISELVNVGGGCGNFVCDVGENCGTCVVDCPCGSGRLCCNNACLTPVCSSNAGCSDGIACTVDVCGNADTCSAVCAHTSITQCINNDGCCPTGCTSANDNNCISVCGNGACDGAETCKSCPSDCSYCPGDVNHDGVVNIVDLSLVGSSFGCTSSCGNADANSDGVVNLFDLVIVGTNFS